MADIIQSFPPELLIEVLIHIPVPDVLGLKQVNRAFRDAILASPLIQHKIELFAAGLEHNDAAGIDLAESRKAFLQYNSSLGSLQPVEERMAGEVQVDADYRSRTAGGVHAVFMNQSVRLFSLGSASRGIPYKEWEIPSPIDDPTGYHIYPATDLIAFVGRDTSIPIFSQIVIYLQTLSDGEPHPEADCSPIKYVRMDTTRFFFISVSLSGSRLAMLGGRGPRKNIAIWDWRSGDLLFELTGEQCSSLEFIDDYHLLAGLGSPQGLPPSLAVIDTEDPDEETLSAVTVFHLPPQFKDFGRMTVLLEQGAYEPSPEESLAPFYPDPAQQIVVLDVKLASYYLAVSVGALLELKSCGARKIRWDEWKSHVVVPRLSLDEMGPVAPWMSGCRLFFIRSRESSPDVQMQVYDFSVQGRAQYLSKEGDESFGGLRCLSPTPARARIPRDRLIVPRSGHDSIVFPRWVDGEDVLGGRCVLNIWEF